MPMNELLPTAAPLQDGEAVAVSAVAAEVVARTFSDSVEPSARAKEKSWPLLERAVVSL